MEWTHALKFETNEILAFGMEVYYRYILAYVRIWPGNIRHGGGMMSDILVLSSIPDICLTYDTIRIPDACISAAG